MNWRKRKRLRKYARKACGGLIQSKPFYYKFWVKETCYHRGWMFEPWSDGRPIFDAHVLSPKYIKRCRKEWMDQYANSDNV